MIASVEGITVEGTPSEIAALLLEVKAKKASGPDTAELTPQYAETLAVVKQHANGIHYTNVADALGIGAAAANSRLFALHKKGFVTRIKAGVYKAIS